MIMQTKNKTAHEIYCDSEYGTLLEVLLCSPRHMKIRDVINETQKHYASENIDADIACRQHDHLLQVLQSRGIKTHLLEAKPEFPEQVFTRDIGFAIHDKLFMAKLKQEIRQGEREMFKHWLQKNDIKAIELANDIEGGDVIVDGLDVWIGVGDRTSSSAAAELQSLLPGCRIYEVKFDPSYLHLDCVFQPISSEEALLFPSAFPPEAKDLLYSKYKPIEVDREEQFTLGTNVLSIGKRTVISMPNNEKVNSKLRQKGYHVIEVELSEIMKSGGAFRCITLPLKRKAASGLLPQQVETRP